VRALWSGPEPFDVDGRYFKLSQVRADPGPAGGARPIVMNAGSSEAGRAFAARNCDVLFTAMIDARRAKTDLATIQALATGFDRIVQIYTSTHVVCRPSRAEAVDYHRHYAVENADDPAVDRLMTLQGLHAQSFPADVFGHFRTRFAGGHGSFPIVGNPDDVAQALAEISALGFGGATIAMVNYLETLPYFVEAVLPRLERLGLRKPKEVSQ
jgi:FMNH2-dependent dimethyl sulfone monooxygenase